MKIVLFIALAAVIAVFVLFSFNWKKKEATNQVEFTRSNEVKTEVVDNQTNRMMSANAQAGGIVATGDMPQEAMNVKPSEYIPSGAPASSGPEKPQLKLSRTYSVKQGRYYGCYDQYTLHKLVKYDDAWDKKRFNKLMDKSIAEGTSVFFRNGEAVRLEEIDSNGKDVRVNRYDDNKSYWTVIEAVK